MKKLMITTAIMAATTYGAVAQTAETPMFLTEADPMAIQASSLIGMNVYTAIPSEEEVAVEAEGAATEGTMATDTATAPDATATTTDTAATEPAVTIADAPVMPGTDVDGVQDGWEDLAEISDVILSREGTVEAVLMDIGGFLGIGARQVAVDMEALQMVGDSSTEEPNDFFLLVNSTREALEQAPEFVTPEQVGEEMAEATEDAAETTDTAVTDTAATTGAATTGIAATDTDAASTDTTTATDGSSSMAADTAAPAATDTMAEGEAAATEEDAREGYVAAMTEEVTADTVEGARVYGAEDEYVGDVSELVLDPQGAITEVIVDVGGFLGIGSKSVALPMTELELLQAEGGDEVRAFAPMTREELEALPEYEG